MKKATSSTIVFVFAALLVSFQSFAQRGGGRQGPGPAPRQEPRHEPRQEPRQETRDHRGGYQPRELKVQPYSQVVLYVNRAIYGQGEIAVKQLVKQQLGLSLEGAEIERIAIGSRLRPRESATAQIEMNHVAVSQRKSLLGHANARTPFQVSGVVQGNLRVLVRGNVIIEEITLRIGRVR